MRTIETKGIWVGRLIGVRVGLIEDTGLEHLVSNVDFDAAAFFEKLQPYFVNNELRRIKCSNCYWQITADEREARAVLHAAFGDKADFVKRHWEVLEIIYPNFARAVSGNIVVIPDFDAHGRPLIVQLEEPEKYCAQDARRRRFPDVRPDNNVKLREANDFAVGGEIAVELIGSGIHGYFVRQKRFCLKRALGDFLESLRNKFFKVHTSPKETYFIK